MKQKQEFKSRVQVKRRIVIDRIAYEVLKLKPGDILNVAISIFKRSEKKESK